MVEVGGRHDTTRPDRCDGPGQRPGRRGGTRIAGAVRDQQNSAHRCRPHSLLSNIGQRPARGSSPGGVRLVHGQQPTDAYPWRSSAFTGTLWREMYASTSAWRPRRERRHLDLAPVGVERRRPACWRGSATRRGAGRRPTRRSRPAPRSSGSTLRMSQHSSGLRAYSRGPNSLVLLGDRLRGADRADGHRQRALHDVAYPQGLGEVQAGVEEDDVDARRHPRHDVGEDGVGERTGDAEPLAELVGGPRDDLLGRLAFQRRDRPRRRQLGAALPGRARRRQTRRSSSRLTSSSSWPSSPRTSPRRHVRRSGTPRRRAPPRGGAGLRRRSRGSTAVRLARSFQRSPRRPGRPRGRTTRRRRCGRRGSGGPAAPRSREGRRRLS